MREGEKGRKEEKEEKEGGKGKKTNCSLAQGNSAHFKVAGDDQF